MRRLYRALTLDRPAPPWLDRSASVLASWWLPLVLVLGTLLYLPYLDARPLRFEEGRRVLQAWEIWNGGSWWHLKVFGEPYLNKPPLLPWLIVLFGYLGGSIDEVAARLPSVLSVLLAAVSAGAMARLLVPARGGLAGLAGGVAVLACGYVLTKGRLGETDPLVTAFCGLAFLVWAWARSRGRLGWGAWSGVSLCLAAAAFAKGPIPVVFPAIAFLAVPLLLRQWREAAAALAAILVSMLPLGLWAYLNLAQAEVAGWAAQMRITDGAQKATHWSEWLYLKRIPLGIAYVLPWFLPAVAMIAGARRQGLRREWPVLALALYALPFGAFVLLWGEARPRYAMPALWPIAVLAGAWIASRWRSGLVPALLLVGGLLYGVIFQLVAIGLVEGETRHQKAFRARAEALAAAVGALPPGPVLLAYTTDGEPDFNSLAYVPRPLTRIDPAAGLCLPEGAYLLASPADRAAVDASGYWTLVEAVREDWMAVYRRNEETCSSGR